MLAFSQETMLSKKKHEEELKKFQLEMRARTIAAPTNDFVCRSFPIFKIYILRSTPELILTGPSSGRQNATS